MRLKKKWYIINYHNVDWGDTDYSVGFRLTISPQLFREHIAMLEKYGQVVSFKEGYKSWIKNEIKEPLISFSFDDGYRGVLNYANDILNEYAAPGLISVCDSCYRHEKVMWRNKLSYIHLNHKYSDLITELKKMGFSEKSDRISKFTLDKFSLAVAELVDRVWSTFGYDEPSVSEKLFLGKMELKTLISYNWELGNHTSNHFPISENSGIHLLQEEFERNSELILEDFGIDPKFYTIPFERVNKQAPNFIEEAKKLFPNKNLVMIGNKANDYNDSTLIHRFASANEHPKDLIKLLTKA